MWTLHAKRSPCRNLSARMIKTLPPTAQRLPVVIWKNNAKEEEEKDYGKKETGTQNARCAVGQRRNRQRTRLAAY